MKHKKTLSLILSFLISSTMLAGCGGKGESTSKGNNNSTGSSNISIGLTTDEGGLNDKSFNQSANEGVLKAKEDFGIKYTSIESQKKEDYEPNLQALVDAGSNLTFGIGYQLADAVSRTAKNNPEASFCLIDTEVKGDNILSVTFKEEEGSFLVGVIAGLMTKTNKIGFIGGKDTETILKFESGFTAGVKAVNPEAAKGLTSSDGSSAGTTVKYADSFADTNKGFELANSLFEAGCDVIYHAAGGVGIGMFQAAQQLKNKGSEVWGIGVDMDQSISLPEYKDVILTSMLKRVDIATYDAVKALVEGNYKPGNKILGIAEGGVGIAETTSNNTPKEVISKVKDYEEKIKAGEIKVPTDRTGVMNFSVQ